MHFEAHFSSMSEDRRTAPRFERILRVRCSYGGETSAVVTLDMGPSGVYLLTPRVPQPGEWVSIQVEEEPAAEFPVELTAQVVRVVSREKDERQLPGSALRWITASTIGSSEFLRDYLKRVLGLAADDCVSTSTGAIFSFEQD